VVLTRPVLVSSTVQALAAVHPLITMLTADGDVSLLMVSPKLATVDPMLFITVMEPPDTATC
jgi:hypothetical protein